MKAIKVFGGAPLFGEVLVSGSKNAALPIIFATIVTKGTSRIEGIPDIGDVRVALDLIRSFGAEVTTLGGATYINTDRLEYSCPDQTLTGAIRASTYLLGATLARFGRCSISDSGGCAFSDRPIDLHLYACRTFGGVEQDGVLIADRLTPATVRFPKISVGATMNALILAAAAEGESRIEGYAREPHVLALCDFLTSAGAKIRFTERAILVRGGRLHGGSVRIIGDMIEAGSYLAAGLVTGGEVTVRGVSVEQLDSFLTALCSVGAKVGVMGDAVTAGVKDKTSSAHIVAGAYPSFPTDLQPIIAPVLATASGGVIEDRVWTSRYGYLDSLAPFGVKYRRLDLGARIYPSALVAARTSSTDLRGGMAALLCALAAKGESRVDTAEYILRGYERPTEKLAALGAVAELSDN